MYKVQTVCRKTVGPEKDRRTIRISVPRRLLVTRNVLGIGVIDSICVTGCVDFEHHINTSLLRSLLNISEYGTWRINSQSLRRPRYRPGPLKYISYSRSMRLSLLTQEIPPRPRGS